MAYKVFTNGSVLNASEINDNLMRQSVMVFSNAAARTAAITSPIEGMLTWLEDVNRYESYNGTAWVSPFGMTHVASVSFTGASTAQISNVFTSEFANYKIFITAFTAAGSPDLQFRLRDGSGDNSTSNYNRQVFLADNTSLSGGRAITQTLGVLGVLNSNWNNTFEVTVFNPNLPTNTSIHSYNFSASNNATMYQSVNNFTATTAFTGLSIFPVSSTFTGTARIYGIRNA